MAEMETGGLGMALSSRLKVLSWSVVLVSSAGLAQVEPPVCTGASRVFTATGQVQSFVVPAGVTSVTIDAAGAAGGAATDLGTQTAAGGSGARLVASFAVTPGETLSVVVGAGGGSNVVSDSGGGGGASYVYRTATASGLLLAAAGGGGAFETVAGGDGQVGAAQAGGGFGVPGAAGSGGNGGGGGTGYCNTGAGGGGLLTDGGDGFNDVNCGGVPVGGGKALANGSAGGTAASGSNGGFGGGGGGGSSAGGGGGGGYNGGGGGSLGRGGGGGSYLDPGAAQLFAVSGLNSGDGSVSICYVAPALPVASPGSLAALAVLLAITAAWALGRKALA